MSGGFVLQSIVVDERAVQVSYFTEGDVDEHGVLIRTASLNPLEFRVEVDELFDAAQELVLAWEGARRETAVPAPAGLRQVPTTERPS
jgi:hypothetical protein